MHDVKHLQAIIDAAFEERAALNPQQHPRELVVALDTCLELLDCGRARVAEKKHGQWVVNEWLKKALLLFFRVHDSSVFESGYTRFFDKVPLKYADMPVAELRASGVRIVPHALVRKGAYVAADVVLMPCYVNIGAYIDCASMIDTWATIGSCAQIGRNVHVSGGAGVGGVLEPLQAAPTIIEDNCFIGARSEIVEGVIVEEGSVISMGVFIGQSTRIYDRESGKILHGRVSRRSGHATLARWSLRARLCRHRQTCRCANARKNFNQRTAARRTLAQLVHQRRHERRHRRQVQRNVALRAVAFLRTAAIHNMRQRSL
jgi:2,3,4,5-tetrahydropyridine-2,6-dicarboxylate N-succinyltransferase